MTENEILKNAKGETDAEKNPVGNALQGAGLAQDAIGGVEKLIDDDWTEGLLDLASGGLDVADLIKNPFESLLSMGFGWLIEHVEFLKEPLDWVTGDQDALDLEVQKWKQISKHVQETGEQLAAAVNKNCAGWRGPAADRYREYAQTQATACQNISDSSRQVGDIVDICKTILNVVRTIIRDLISDALAKVVMIICKYPPPAYPAALAAEGMPFLIQQGNQCAQMAARASRVLMRAKEFVSMIMRDLPKIVDEALTPLLKKLPENIGMEVGKEVVKQLSKIVVGEVGKDDSTDPNDQPVGRESHEKRQQDRKRTTIDKPEPLFEQPGTKRISGSI